ncbi:hypothetical protein PR202_ga25198 [Eleusine coracana subsp. coracana]|uniref:DNA 3'-5' helicase n=1 Tax=Eleusine coracana subsp. coracana TaxID=191504 RepID=A0AAV5DB09_ELECO|nr:hypothetical protein PR202_ga25198 [Eleusine coracana subsp. coracana]
MSRWKENASPLSLHPRGTSNPSPLLPCKRPAQSPSPCPPPRRPLADVSGNALEQRSGGERCVYGSNTPLPKTPRPCGFVVEEDDDMDEAFLQEVDAICEEHTRSAASKEKKAAERDRETVGGSLSASTLINDSRPGFEDVFWKINAVREEHHTKSPVKDLEVSNELEGNDGLVASCGDASVSPVVSNAKGDIQPIDALSGDVDATIREGHAALCAAMDQEELQDIELEIEDKERCAPSKYYEYLHSLNDKQREAACSDVNIPLMIVAGPGSGKAKASGRTPEEYEKKGDLTGASVLHHYNEILRSCNALDYHDFINSSITLLMDFPEVYKECQDMWQAIVVDEFQDTSAMQYCLLKILASHSRITIVGDEDQSIFSFNGANASGFDSFRRDFPNHKEIRLSKNYRSTRAIAEAAIALIHNNTKRRHHKLVETDNPSGCKITVKECHSEDSQCAFVIDKIIETTSSSAECCNFGNVAVLYRRQITGKAFQVAFRNRKIPFNVHGVAFYRKKIIKAIIAILQTTLPGCDDGPWRQAFKALLPSDKEEKKKVQVLPDSVLFLPFATDIFSAKVSGTFKRAQITQGRKVLSTLDGLSKLVEREQSVSIIISSAGDMLPQKYLLEKACSVDVDNGPSVLWVNGVPDFLSTHFLVSTEEAD